MLMTADEWNERYPIGTKVRACPGLPATEGGAVLGTETRSKAWTLGHGEPVVAVKGYPGGIALTHIEVVGEREDVGASLNSDTLDAINGEFARAFQKHNGKTPRSHSVGDAQSLVILVEEVGEVARAMTYDEGDQENLYAELIQVATMAAAWAERLAIRGDA